MNTKNLINALRECKNPYMIMHYSSAEMIADHLEDLENQLDEQKEINKQFANCCIDPKEGQQPEWISVGDRLPAAGELVLVSTKNNRIAIYAFSTDSICDKSITHWMPLPEPPKPKESTFKDKFLEAFPKTKIEEGIPKVCVEDIFPWVKYPRCNGKNCDKCWNRPYFEEKE